MFELQQLENTDMQNSIRVSRGHFSLLVLHYRPICNFHEAHKFAVIVLVSILVITKPDWLPGLGLVCTVTHVSLSLSPSLPLSLSPSSPLSHSLNISLFPSPSLFLSPLSLSISVSVYVSLLLSYLVYPKLKLLNDAMHFESRDELNMLTYNYARKPETQQAANSVRATAPKLQLVYQQISRRLPTLT